MNAKVSRSTEKKVTGRKTEIIFETIAQNATKISKTELISFNSNNIFLYYPSKTKTKNYDFYHSLLGSVLRKGLVIKVNEQGSNKILLRGLPKIYPYTEVKKDANYPFYQKFEKFSFNLFKNKKEDISMSFRQIKILSEHNIQISYVENLNKFILLTNKKKCVLFRTQNELEDFLGTNKIDDLLYEMCSFWLGLLLKIEEDIGRKNYKDFLKFLNDATLIGYYLGEEKSVLDYPKRTIVFHSVVSNVSKFSQFSFPFEECERIFERYSLNYQKALTLPKYQNITTQENFMSCIHDLYVEVTSDYLSNQQKGSIILILDKNTIISSVKILNHEMLILNAIMKGGDFKYDENEQNIEFSDSTNETDKIPCNIQNTDFISKSIIDNKFPVDIEVYVDIQKEMKKLFATSTAVVTSAIKSKINEILLNQDHPGISPIASFISKTQVNFNPVNHMLLEDNAKKETPSKIRSSLTFADKNATAKVKKSLIHYKEEMDTSPTEDSYPFTLKKTISCIETNKSKRESLFFHPKRAIFMDERFGKPIADVIDVESFKKFNLGNTYNESYEYDDKSNQKVSTCCCIY